jgi:hypothetical protein
VDDPHDGDARARRRAAPAELVMDGAMPNSGPFAHDESEEIA